MLMRMRAIDLIWKMAAERERLRRVLNRFKKDELSSAVRWLGGREELSKRRSKKDIISSTLDDFVVSSVATTI